MYRHSLRAKLMAVLTVVSFLVFAYTVDILAFRLIFMLIAAIMAKDSLRVFTASYYVDDNGLFSKDIFGKRQLVDWYQLEYITITKRNKAWIALTTGAKVKYIRNDIENRQQLLQEIVAKARKNKKLAIHDDINTRYQLGLRLDERGRIIHRK